MIAASKGAQNPKSGFAALKIIAAVFMFFAVQATPIIIWGTRISAQQEFLLERMLEIRESNKEEHRNIITGFEKRYNRLEAFVDEKTRNGYHTVDANKSFAAIEQTLRDLRTDIGSVIGKVHRLEVIVYTKHPELFEKQP